MNLKLPSDPAFAASALKAWPAIDDKLAEREAPARVCDISMDHMAAFGGRKDLRRVRPVAWRRAINAQG